MNDVSGRFRGGPLDGELSPGHDASWYVEDGHAYALRADEWVYVGVECSNCHSGVEPGSDGRIPERCPLCGSALARAAQTL